MRRRGLVVLVASVVLLVLLVGGGLLYVRTRTAREQIRAYVERSLARELGLPVHLGGVSLSLRLGTVQLKQLTVSDGTSGVPLLGVDRIRVSLALLSLLGGELRVRSVAIHEPRLSVEDSPELRTVLARVASRVRELSREQEVEGFPIRVEGGAVRYRNPAAGVAFEASGFNGSLSWASSERVTTLVSVGAIQVSLGGRGVSGIRLDGRARVGRDVVEVEHLRLDHGRSTLTLTGVILAPAGPPRVELTATGELVLEELVPAVTAQTGWSGRLSVGGKLFGEGLPRTFEGRLGLADGGVAGVPVRLATAAVLLRPDRLEVVSLSAQAGGGSLSGSGVFEPGERRWRANTQLSGVNLGDLLQAAGRPSGIAGRITGIAEGSGRGTEAGELALRLNLAGRDLRLPDGERRAEGMLLASARAGMLRVERLALTRGRSSISLRGTVDLKTEALALGLTATVGDLAADFWPIEVRGLGGRLSVTGRVGRTLRRPGFTGQVSLRNVSFRGWHADSVEGLLEADPARVAFRGLRLSAARTTATLSGEARLGESNRKWATWRDDLHLALRADLRGRIEDLAARSPQEWPVAGPIIFQARLGGTPSALEGGGQVDMREFRIGGERFEALRATLAFKGSELTAPRLTARRGGVPIQAEGAIDTDGRYRFSVLPVKLDVAMIPPLAAAGARGTAVLRVKGVGKWPELGLEGNVRLTDAVFRELEVGNGSLGFALDGKQWRWELSLAVGLKARGVAPLAGSGPLQAEVTATSLDLMPLLPGLRPQLPFPLTARADGHAAVRGTLPGLRDLGSQIELTAAGQAGEVPWRTREPARLALEAGALRLESLDLVGPGLAVTIRGSVRPGERTDLDLSGHAPVAILRSWVPPLADLRGAPDVRLSLVGPVGDLRVVGRADLSRVDVKLKPVPIWLSIASGEVRFNNDSLQYKVREGAAAGGRLEGQGTGHRDGQRWRHTVDFRLDKAQMEPIYEQIQSDRRWASGDLFARGSLAFEAAPGQSALPILRGRVSLALDGGSLSSYPALVRIFGLLGSIAQPYRLPDLTRERMPYRRISADFDVRDGVMETKNLLLDSEVVRVSGVGKVMLADQTVDLDLAVRPLQVLEQGIRRIPLLGRLMPQEQGLVIAYFDMQGPWADPAISVASLKSLSETVVDILLFLLKAPGRVINPNP